MTFTPLMANTVKQIRPYLGNSPQVVEFGNQRFTANNEFATTKEFYKAQGFSSYLALDVNTEKDAIVVDLNELVELDQQFELVTNNGTSEHIFNQHMVFKNAHNLCKQGGIMLHSLPMTPWINHGFFNYNPILFRDLAYANNYQIVLLNFSNRWGFGVETNHPFVEKNPYDLQKAIDVVLRQGKGDVFVTVALQKTDNTEFRLPFQGKFRDDIESSTLKQRYGQKKREIPSVLANASEVLLDPFPHVVIENCLPEEFYQELYDSRPTDQQILAGRNVEENQRVDLSARLALQSDMSPIWKAFIEYHTSNAFWQEVCQLFGCYIELMYPGLVYKNGLLQDWNTAIRGTSTAIVQLECQPGINTPLSKSSRVRGPHLDNPVELYGALLYMRDREDKSTGGDLQLCRIKNKPQFHGKLEVSDEQVEIVKTIPYKENTLVMFLNSPLAFHAVTTRSPSNYSRKLVSIAGEVQECLFRTGHGPY